MQQAKKKKKTHIKYHNYMIIYMITRIYIYIIRAAGYMFCNCSHFSPYNFYQMLDFKLTSSTNIDTTTFKSIKKKKVKKHKVK